MLGLLLALAWLMVGCSRAESHSAPRADYELDLVEIPGGPVEMGFTRGTLRWTEQVAALRVGRLPVSVGELERCVDAGVCDPIVPTDSCWPASVFPEAQRPGDAPELCASIEQAKQYCRWHGARLPTPSEWLLAVRGASVQRFPWGNSSATPAQHLLAAEARAPGGRILGDHPEGASAYGVQDALPLGAELLGPSPESRVKGCRAEGCAAAGTEPGAIDRWGTSEEAFAAFRCVKEMK
ncbi:MAG: formylglycine-generating enzyme family protein [Polyangiaceae bacterium]